MLNIGWTSMLRGKNRIMIVTTRQKWQHLDKMDINICIKGDKLQVGFVLILLSSGRPIYKIYTTRLLENSHFSAG